MIYRCQNYIRINSFVAYFPILFNGFYKMICDVRKFKILSLRFRYSEMNIREKSKKIVSIIATSSYDTFLLYPSQISEYARRGQKLPKCSKKATIRLHIFKAK